MAKEQEKPLDIADLVEQLRPYIPGLVETIGLAGQAVTDDKGKKKPGDVKAASIGLELVGKHLSGKGSNRSTALIEAVRAIREHAVDVPVKGGNGSNGSHPSGEGTDMESA